MPQKDGAMHVAYDGPEHLVELDWFAQSSLC